MVSTSIFLCSLVSSLFPFSFSSFLSTFLSLSVSLFLFACLFHMGPGLTFTLARVLASSTYRWARLATHRPQGTHNTSCAARALVPTLAAQPPHVCHRQETGLWRRTCSRTSTFPKRLHFRALRSLCLNTVHVRKTTIRKIGANFP